MSVVLAVATDSCIFMMSDGRVYDEINGRILQEDCEKLFKFNENVCVGFAGHLLSCEGTIHGLNIHMSYDETYNYLTNNAKYIYSQYNQNILMFVAGISKNEIKLKSFSICGEFKEFEYAIPSYTMLFKNNNYSELFKQNLNKCLVLNRENVYNAMKNTIDYISNHDVTVNRNYYTKIIER